jgi:hypothetical protein
VLEDSTDEPDGTARAKVPPLAAEDFACPSCPFSYADTSIAAAVEIIQASPPAVRAVVAGTPVDLLRRRPAAGGWSIVEYLCHLRDVYVTSTIRLYRARTEDRPVLEPMLNDLRAERFRYNEWAVHSVLDELTATAAGCCEEIGRMRPGDELRTVTRRPGEVRTALWLGRQAAHESTHHLRDMQRLDDQFRTTPPTA